jgi:hypothetical protein
MKQEEGSMRKGGRGRIQKGGSKRKEGRKQ